MTLRRELAQRAATAPGCVYFIVQTHELVGRGLTKVGWAAKPKRRLSEIQVGSPYLLETWGLFPAERSAELHAHAVLAPYRVRGEWFALQGAVDVVHEAVTSGLSLNAALAAIVAHLQVETAETLVALGTPNSGVR
jgi:hypothetical protein